MIGGTPAALLLCALGLVLLRRDLDGLVRRLRWRRARGTIVFLPTPSGPSWRIDFTLPQGTPVQVVTTDLRLIARREGAGAVTLLYDPAEPTRIDLPARPGLPVAVGLGLLCLGVAQLLR